MERIINKQQQQQKKKIVFVGLLSVILGPNDREKQKKIKKIENSFREKGNERSPFFVKAKCPYRVFETRCFCKNQHLKRRWLLPEPALVCPYGRGHYSNQGA